MATTVREVIDYLSQFPDDTLVALLAPNPRTESDYTSEYYKGTSIILWAPGNYIKGVDEHGSTVYLKKKGGEIDKSAPNKIVILG